MPEGDTIHRLANAIAPRLVGARLERVEMEQREREHVRHGVVRSVRAVGKHLLIGVDDVFFRTHLGMDGSWHRYPRERSWRRPGWQASLVLETADQTYVCFNASEVDCIPAARLALHRPLRRLGPDLLGEEVDFGEILQRARRSDPTATVADLLLDQRIASGIGNVYKSELLFLRRHHPWTKVVELDDGHIGGLFREGRRLLLDNVHRAHRTTTGLASSFFVGSIPRLWVYDRAGQPCLRCDTEIRFARVGRDRVTYWCPRCQDAAA